jgi:hypothetical protein
MAIPPPLERLGCVTYQYPKTQQKSGDRPSRSQRMVDACSWPYQCGQPCKPISSYSLALSSTSREVVLDNVRADWCLEDIGERVGVVGGGSIGANDGDGRSAGHFAVVVST